MKTLYGKEAKEGDYVLISDVGYMQSIATIIPAKVVGDKAFAAKFVPYKQHIGMRWLRKVTAVITIPESEVTAAEKQLIEMNINCPKSTFEVAAPEYHNVWVLLEEANKERVAKMSN